MFSDYYWGLVMAKKRVGVVMEDLLGAANSRGESVKEVVDDGWGETENASGIFCEEAKGYFEQKYEGCVVSASAVNSGNVDFNCSGGSRIGFRVQARGVKWTKDTLVISNLSELHSFGARSPFEELLGFIFYAKNKVGYSKLGLEYPGRLGLELVKRYGFIKYEHLDDCWIIEISKLQRMDRGMEFMLGIFRKIF